MNIPIIRCRHCGGTFTGEEKTLAALRKRARLCRWRVAVPMWMTGPWLGSREAYWDLHPGSKGKTVNSCPRCSAEHSIKNQRDVLSKRDKTNISPAPLPKRIM
jgi:hypothetical protein